MKAFAVSEREHCMRRHLEKDAALLGVCVAKQTHTHKHKNKNVKDMASESAAGTAVEGGAGLRLQGLVPLKSLFSDDACFLVIQRCVRFAEEMKIS